jgi:alpha 1,3-glucosidase
MRRYTLFIALDSSDYAAGELYIDDEHSLGYRNGEGALRKFTFSNGALVGSSVGMKNT